MIPFSFYCIILCEFDAVKEYHILKTIARKTERQSTVCEQAATDPGTYQY
jgi:hypothetical protein